MHPSSKKQAPKQSTIRPNWAVLIISSKLEWSRYELILIKLRQKAHKLEKSGTQAHTNTDKLQMAITQASIR